MQPNARPNPPLAVSQVLGVSHSQDNHGNGQIVFNAMPLGGHDRRVAAAQSRRTPKQRITLDLLHRHIDGVRNAIDGLLGAAVRGWPRNGLGIEAAAAALAAHVLPQGGFLSVLPPRVDPRFSIVEDAASLIPWEVLDERYVVCDQPGHEPFVMVYRQGVAAPGFCGKCGHPLASGGEWLALNRRVSHVVPGGGPPADSSADFLLILDPTQNLFDPQGRCDASVTQLEQMLTSHGFQVTMLAGPAATVTAVKAALAGGPYAGLYYFGHGYFPLDGDEGCLELAGGRLYATEIEELNPAIPFVFINACQGAALGGNWDVERKFRSVGRTFAEGQTGAVIAALWPVVNVQAADAAVEFFTAALDGRSLLDALQVVRRQSHARYQAGAPDISWLAYRYFGDPDQTLRLAPPPPPPRVFVDGHFNPAAFSFDVPGVMRRAARRRLAQHRGLLTVTDLVTGLLRRGDLLRAASRRLRLNPDRAYDALLAEAEAVPGGTPATTEEPPTDPAEFHAALTELLGRADATAQQRGAAAVTERDVLAELLAGGGWPVQTRAPLPDPATVRGWLDSGERTHLADDDGRLRLDDLEADARRVVKTAQKVAQQRGQYPIPHRLVAAAFMAAPRGDALNDLFRRLAVDADGLSAKLVALTESQPPDAFPLSLEAADGPVLKMLTRARRTAAGAPIDEVALFRAFCQEAGADFKKLLLTLPPPLRLNLDALAAGDPAPAFPRLYEYSAQLKDSAWVLLLKAAEVARQTGWAEVRSRHLLYAMLDQVGDSTLRNKGQDPDQFRAKMRQVMGRGPEQTKPPRERVGVGDTAERAVRGAIAAAQADGRPRASASDLVTVLFAAPAAPSNGRPKSEPLTISITPDAVAAPVGEPEVLGRDDEIGVLLQDLVMTDGLSPLLVGPPGVGKKAIIGGLAKRIAQGQCPPRLRDAKLTPVPLAGPSDALEARTRPVLDAAAAGTVLLLRDLHRIADSPVGAAVAAALENALSREGVRAIATTTPTDLPPLQARFPALLRLFRPWPVEPPDRTGCQRVLLAHLPALEAAHGVAIANEALDAAVDLTAAELPTRAFPGVPREVLERACVLAATRGEGQAVLRSDVEQVVATLARAAR